jgi:hypothetical protein
MESGIENWQIENPYAAATLYVSRFNCATYYKMILQMTFHSDVTIVQAPEDGKILAKVCHAHHTLLSSVDNISNKI